MPTISKLSLGAVSPPWRILGVPTQEAALTQFTVVELDGQHVLKIHAKKAYGNAVVAINGSGTGTMLQWRWRLDQGLQHSDLRTKAGDDTALKVCVLFDMAIDKIPFGERLQVRLARTLSGEDLPAATLCYVWDRFLPIDASLPNAYSRRVRYKVLASTNTPLKQWQSHSRDLKADFLAIFGDESSALPPIKAIAVGADTDNTGDESLGYVGDWVIRE